jgi:sRNA-binding protein
MQVIMDGLLFAATLFAGTYCWVLARRVRALGDLDKGLGGAITTMNRQIEQARAALAEARGSSRESRAELKALIEEAEDAAHQLRALLAALHGAKRPAARPAPRPTTAKPAPARSGLTEDSDPEVPKPRRTVSFDDLLRPAAPAPEPPRTEAEILEALAALAGNAGR